MSIAITTMSCSNSDLSSGIRTENLDTTVKPGDDFYEFAVGSWLKTNPLPPEYARYGAFEIIGESNRKRLNDLIVEL